MLFELKKKKVIKLLSKRNQRFFLKKKNHQGSFGMLDWIELDHIGLDKIGLD